MGRCICCSIRCAAIFVVFVAAVPTLISPLLDYLIVGVENKRPNLPPALPAYVEGKTTIEDYPRMNFLNKNSTRKEIILGLRFILSQSMPRWIVKVADNLGLDRHNVNENENENHNVTIRNAREEKNLRYDEAGFTMLSLSAPSATTDWRSKENVKLFHKEIEPQIRELHPGVKRIYWTTNVIRGGTRLGDQPAAVDGPHLDYSQNDTEREMFYKKWPVNERAMEQTILLGRNNSEDEEFRIMLGIWKPVNMNTPVCDHPLAVMDSRTFTPAMERPFDLHMDFGSFTLHNLNGAVTHHPDQRWYYYPNQTTEEVLVFRQYTHQGHGHKRLANPHSSFSNPHCPPGMDPRMSVELRCCLFF